MSRAKWKQEVLERDNFQCQICGGNHSLTVHHKLPKARGGQSSIYNGVTWCKYCHNAYHSRFGLARSDNFGNPLDTHFSKRAKQKKRGRRKKWK